MGRSRSRSRRRRSRSRRQHKRSRSRRRRSPRESREKRPERPTRFSDGPIDGVAADGDAASLGHKAFAPGSGRGEKASNSVISSDALAKAAEEASKTLMAMGPPKTKTSVLDALASLGAPPAQTPTAPKGTGMKVCVSYMSGGRCSRGDTCPLKHHMEEKERMHWSEYFRKVPCKAGSACGFLPQCVYFHPAEERARHAAAQLENGIASASVPSEAAAKAGRPPMLALPPAPPPGSAVAAAPRVVLPPGMAELAQAAPPPPPPLPAGTSPAAGAARAPRPQGVAAAAPSPATPAASSTAVPPPPPPVGPAAAPVAGSVAQAPPPAPPPLPGAPLPAQAGMCAPTLPGVSGAGVPPAPPGYAAAPGPPGSVGVGLPSSRAVPPPPPPDGSFPHAPGAQVVLPPSMQNSLPLAGHAVAVAVKPKPFRPKAKLGTREALLEAADAAVAAMLEAERASMMRPLLR